MSRAPEKKSRETGTGEGGVERRPRLLPPTVSAPSLLDGGSDRRFRQMVYDLLFLESVMRRARDRFAEEIGVSGPAYGILMTIGQEHEDRGLRVSDVASRLHVSGAFVTREANRLVAEGLIEKRPDPDDGRAVRLHLTDLAERRIAGVAPMVRGVNDHLFGHLSAEEFAVLSRLAARIGDRADGIAAEVTASGTAIAAAE